ncbi:hypothetical protein ONS95_003367 [Cadophora gregata]|uniref:uncharacterized protein n=1 Tax=Cadophora gregata TaxID=51156 RepID=UPI0026DA7979|nr:uncharacterized protein ONS95_003367 [Cadophora gregata]KAK0108569.1 hypothetical protein ONS95_003367 [Cadophora gregata]KAK0108837.1 hypothetical protein ONS96_002678 [Cadophora gregata f. sp. sojae]
MADENSPKQGLLADPNSTVPVIERQGKIVAIFDVVWRTGENEIGNRRGYADKTLTITRIQTEDENYLYRTYKAYFTYRICYGNITDILENEYNCKASEDETRFYDFTFLRRGEHEAMEKPRFYFPEYDVLDENKRPFMGLCMVQRKTLYEQEVVAAWAKARDKGMSWKTSKPAELTDEEYEMLSDKEGVAMAEHQVECLDHWFGGPRRRR